MYILYLASMMLVTIIYCSNSLTAIGSIFRDGENEDGKCIEFRHTHVTRNFGKLTSGEGERQP